MLHKTHRITWNTKSGERKHADFYGVSDARRFLQSVQGENIRLVRLREPFNALTIHVKK